MKIACGVLSVLACAAAFGTPGTSDTCVQSRFAQSPAISYTGDGSMLSMFGMIAEGGSLHEQTARILATADQHLATHAMTKGDVVMVKVLLPTFTKDSAVQQAHATRKQIEDHLGINPAFTMYAAGSVCKHAKVQISMNAQKGEKTFFTNGVKTDGIAFSGAVAGPIVAGNESMLVHTENSLAKLEANLEEVGLGLDKLTRIRGSIMPCTEVCKEVSPLDDAQVDLLRKMNYEYNQYMSGMRLPVMDSPFVALNLEDGALRPPEELQYAAIAVDNPRTDLPGTTMAPATGMATNHPNFVLPYSFMGGTADGSIVWIAGFHDAEDTTANMTLQTINTFQAMKSALESIDMSLANVVQLEASLSYPGADQVDAFLAVWNAEFSQFANPPSLAIEVLANLGGDMLVGFLAVAAKPKLDVN